MSGGWRESAHERSVHSDTASCRYTPCCHGNIVAVDHLLINCLCNKCWKDGLERCTCTVCPNVLHLSFLFFLSCSSLLPSSLPFSLSFLLTTLSLSLSAPAITHSLLLGDSANGLSQAALPLQAQQTTPTSPWNIRQIDPI